MAVTKPFILNVDAKVAHRRAGLTEMCNTDDLKHRRNGSLVPQSYRKCQHCFPQFEEAAAEEAL